MCGIAGYKINRPIDNSILEKMVNSLYHRGPDSVGYYNTKGYHAGMRRLSINGLQSGDQPLYNENKNVVLLYNGEIYNYPELRNELEKKGCKFRTYSDGEVVCHLYENYGEDLFEKLDGMYAIALWVEDEKKLILARDIPGEKPLYYNCISDNEIVFASEIKSLVKFSELEVELNPQAIWDLPTFTWIPQPETIYKSIKSIDKGQILVVDDKGIKTKEIKNKYLFDVNTLNETDIIEYTRDIVVRSIKKRLLSDVPIGCFLSGGLDSSLVATISSKELNQLDTFTVAFENIDDPYGHGKTDESKMAAEYAKALGTNHHNVYVNSTTFKSLLSQYVNFGDQPFAVPSGLGILAISKVARDADIKVLLSGDCADECFGGYSWYPYLSKVDNDFTLDDYSMPNNDITFNSHGLSVKERLETISKLPAPKRAWAWHYYASELEKENIFNMDFFQKTKSSINHFNSYNSDHCWEPQEYIRQDRNFYLKNEMLQKLDRMTMANSVEGRVPFCSPEILQFSDMLDFNYMVRGNTIKWLLKKAFLGVIPQKIINRKKHGFNVPIDHWLRNEWSDLVENTFCKDSKIMELGIITHKSKKVVLDMLKNTNKQNGPTIFSIIILNLWLENFYGNNC